MDYAFFGDFLTYIQIMAGFNFGFYCIKKGALIQELQCEVIHIMQYWAKPILNRAGEVTKSCRQDRLSKTEKGREILGLADKIRGMKKSFNVLSMTEKRLTFMPAMGILSGIFCIIYMVLIPLLLKNGNETFLFFLEYAAEAIFISHCIVLSTLWMTETFPGNLAALILGIFWFIIIMVFTTILYCCELTITCFDADVYLYFFLLLPLVPIIVMIVRIFILAKDRYIWAKEIKALTDELEKKKRQNESTASKD